MPIYEYKCDACEHEFEALQKMSDNPLKDCPECSEASLRKKVSAAAFRLKGGGWYETDFKSGNKKNLAGEGDKPATGDSKKAETGGGEKKAKKDAGGDSGKKAAGSSGASTKSGS